MKKTILAAVAASLLCLVSPTIAAAQYGPWGVEVGPWGVEVGPFGFVGVRDYRRRERCVSVILLDAYGYALRDSRGRPVTERHCYY